MAFLAPTLPPYDPIAWRTKPFHERARLVCEAWAMQGYGSPFSIYLVYLLKIAGYIGGFVYFCGQSPSLGGLGSIASWWLAPLAFEKAVLWSALFEVLGLGCGSGPLTARYVPPVGGFLYFLRPGTTRLPLFPKLPLFGGYTRTVFDVLLYLALVVILVWTLLAPLPGPPQFILLALLLPFLGLRDKTIFLAARAEHYWVTIVCFAFATDWIPGAKAVTLALWFWAGFSKLNHHFPTVVCVMTSNGPFTRFPWIRRQVYKNYPSDLRPSTLANFMAHAGTAFEFGVPIAFLLTPLGTPPVVAMGLMLCLHLYITSNVPMGVPLEWNVMVVYSAFALFWAHPSASLLSIGPPWLAVFLVGMLVLLPLLGNLFPRSISFLCSMRYYAGNWAYSVWLFRGDSRKKLSRLTTSAGWVDDQLGRLYDNATTQAILGKVMGFRMMHLHGRALPILVPKAIANDLALEDYEWADGEVVAGHVLGWNFGDGHLHDEDLLRAVQEKCGFEEGELRCIFVESQPLFQSTLSYRIRDAKSGQLDSGKLSIQDLRSRQPWEAPA
jgi:Transmembrane protein of unknown function (DUF3556)